MACILLRKECPQRILGTSYGDKTGATRAVKLQKREIEGDVMASTVGVHTG